MFQVRATCPTHLSFDPCDNSCCEVNSFLNFLQYSATSAFSRPNTSSILCSLLPSICSLSVLQRTSLNCECRRGNYGDLKPQ